MSIFNSCIEKKNNALLESVISNSSNIETLEEGVFKYTPSMIPVCSRETEYGTKYLVEYSMLSKLAAYNDMDILESFEAVCNENCLSESDVFVLCPDIYNSICESADAIIGSEDDEDISYYENKMESITSGYNALMENGINILFESEKEKLPSVFNGIKGYWKMVMLNFKSDNYGSTSALPKFKYEYEKALKKCKTYEDFKYIRYALKGAQKDLDDSYSFATEKGAIKWFNDQDEFLKEKLNELSTTTRQYKKGEQYVEKQKAKEAKKAAKAARKAGAEA